MRRVLPLALGAAALAVALAAVAQGLVCGASEVAVSEDGALPATCVPVVHPFLPAIAVAVAAGVAGLWRGRRDLPLGLGVALALLGVPMMFSVGLVMVAAGLLLVAAAAALPRPAEAPPPFPAALALAAVGLVFAVALVAPSVGFGDVFPPLTPATFVAAVLASAGVVAVAARSVRAARVLGAAALAWGLWRAPTNALGDLFPAFFVAGAAVLLAPPTVEQRRWMGHGFAGLAALALVADLARSAACPAEIPPARTVNDCVPGLVNPALLLLLGVAGALGAAWGRREVAAAGGVAMLALMMFLLGDFRPLGVIAGALLVLAALALPGPPSEAAPAAAPAPD